MLHFGNGGALIRRMDGHFFSGGCVTKLVHRERAFCGGGHRCPQLERRPMFGAKAYIKSSTPHRAGEGSIARRGLHRILIGITSRSRVGGEINEKRLLPSRAPRIRGVKSELVLIETCFT